MQDSLLWPQWCPYYGGFTVQDRLMWCQWCLFYRGSTVQNPRVLCCFLTIQDAKLHICCTRDLGILVALGICIISSIIMQLSRTVLLEATFIFTSPFHVSVFLYVLLGLLGAFVVGSGYGLPRLDKIIPSCPKLVMCTVVFLSVLVLCCHGVLWCTRFPAVSCDKGF